MQIQFTRVWLISIAGNGCPDGGRLITEALGFANLEPVTNPRANYRIDGILNRL
jgi:hypothetical protein